MSLLAPDLPPSQDDMAGLKAAQALYSIPMLDGRVGHGSFSDLRLQASLERRPCRVCPGCSCRRARGKPSQAASPYIRAQPSVPIVPFILTREIQGYCWEFGMVLLTVMLIIDSSVWV
jgi:hypothetical protein